MQQPFPVPDDYDEEGIPLPEPPRPRATPEAAAEHFALEVFPGVAELDSDEWWQPPESAEADGTIETGQDDAEIEDATEFRDDTPVPELESEWESQAADVEPAIELTTDERSADGVSSWPGRSSVAYGPADASEAESPVPFPASPSVESNTPEAGTPPIPFEVPNERSVEAAAPFETPAFEAPDETFDAPYAAYDAEPPAPFEAPDTGYVAESPPPFAAPGAAYEADARYAAQAAAVPQAGVQPPIPPQAPPAMQPPATRGAMYASEDEAALERSLMSMPLLSGREAREAAGASQREAIMAQAGVTLDPETDGPTSAAPGLAAAAAGPASKGGWFSRRMRLSLIVIGLTLVALWGGAVATGQGTDVGRGASALAPDVIEQWISDRVSALSGSSPETVADPGNPIVSDEPTPSEALIGHVAHTGGSGVPVRSTCVVEARTPRVISEGTPVTVIARGVGDCSGWDVVRAGATISWIESAYLEPTPAP